MITLPEHVQEGDNWKGSSVDHMTGHTNPNRESEMDFAEHQRIVCNARQLLVSMNFSQQEQDASPAKAKLMLLKAAYENNDGGALYISKGIHQPHSSPHIQLRVVVDQTSHLFHLDVTAEDVVTDIGNNEHFHWRGARFTARVAKPKEFMKDQEYDDAWWPLDVNVVKKSSSKIRRNSVSPPMLLAINERIEEEQAAAQRQSEQQNKRNKLVKDVETKLKLKPADGGQLRKLWEGKPANFKTQTGKIIACTYDGTHFTHNNGQKLTV